LLAQKTLSTINSVPNHPKIIDIHLICGRSLCLSRIRLISRRLTTNTMYMAGAVKRRSMAFPWGRLTVQHTVRL